MKKEETVKFEAKDNFIVRALNEENNDFIITIGRHLATTKHFERKEENMLIHLQQKEINTEKTAQ